MCLRQLNTLQVARGEAMQGFLSGAGVWGTVLGRGAHHSRLLTINLKPSLTLHANYAVSNRKLRYSRRRQIATK